MKALFFILIGTVISVLIWQVVKLRGLLKKDQVPTEKDNNINGWLMLGFLAFLYALMIYCLVAYRAVLLPQASASLEGYHIDVLFKISMGLILVAQFILQFLIFYFAFKYRGKDKNRKAFFFADSHKLELFWTIIPAIVLAGLIIYGIWTWNYVTDVTNKDDNPLYIELYSKQFSWEARYAGTDNILGEANVRFIKGKNTMGVDMRDKNSADDKTVMGELRLPKGRKVIFQLRSQDVIHSAYMPHFRAQINTVPGMKTYMGFTPSMTTEEMRKDKDVVKKMAGVTKARTLKSKELIAKGEEALDPYEFDFLLLCNKICGNSHYNMQMKIVVEEEDDFNKWLGEQKTLTEVLQ